MAEVEANGVRLHYEVTGDGPPLVFVHGMCGRGAVWAGQVERLSGEFTCVTYDRRGHGSSDDGAEPHSVPLHGDDFAALVTALELGPVLYVGSSGGARVGVDVVLRHAGLLAGVVRAAGVLPRSATRQGVHGPGSPGGAAPAGGG